jgi:RNA 2',3'-cyclic 3'-phosphodiesterase
MEPNIIRAFFAIKPPKDSLEQIETATLNLRKSLPNTIKWLPSDSIHITLKFLGAFNSDHINTVENNLSKNLDNFGNFKFSIGNIGVFPNPKKTKIIWLGVNDDNQIDRIMRTLNTITGDLGYGHEDGKFSPHITIGRVRNSIANSFRPQIGEKVLKYKIPPIDKVFVDKMSFIKSDLTQKGPIYTTIFETKF